MKKEKESNYKIAKILVLIPLIVFAITVICFVFGIILAVLTDMGALYTFVMLISLAGVFLSPMPCFASSMVGSIFAFRARIENARYWRLFFVLGIISSIVSIFLVVLDLYIIFVLGPGV